MPICNIVQVIRQHSDKYWQSNTKMVPTSRKDDTV